ncbi:MAG: 6,7-dimethyl-8-ribityllumazine synthase [bacterium]
MLKTLPTRPRTTVLAASRFVIVASRYNHEYVSSMVAKAQQEITAIESQALIEVVYTPGSFEIPFLARQIIEYRKPDAVICLGVILRGETGHADLIAASVSNALCNLSMETGTPVIHGVLLLNNEEQAKSRCLGNEFNRGTEAARAAIEVLRESRNIVSR